MKKYFEEKVQIHMAQCNDRILKKSAKGFDKTFIENEQFYKGMFDSETPETHPVAGEWETKLDYF